MKTRKRSKLPQEDPPEPLEDQDLLADLRNLIVTEDSETLRTLLAAVNELKRKVEDRRGLIDLLKPVLPDLLREAAAEDPEAIRKALEPLFTFQVKHAGRREPSGGLRFVSSLQAALSGAAERVAGLFRAFRGRGGGSGPVLQEISGGGAPAEVLDASFALEEIFLLARPSLVLLGHGTWLPPSEAQGDYLLVQIRRFLSEKGGGADQDGPLQAQVGSHRLYIESGRNALLAVLYRGTAPVGFFLDVRQSLADLHCSLGEALRRAQVTSKYRPTLRLLLDRYRPSETRLSGTTRTDPLTWPPPSA